MCMEWDGGMGLEGGGMYVDEMDREGAIYTSTIFLMVIAGTKTVVTT